MNPKTPSEHERGGVLPIVVLAVLIEAGPEGLDTEQVAREARRDYDSDPEREEVATALVRLAKKNLVLRDGERWRSTPAALEARVLSV
jgi:hypothetical protein